MQILSLPWLAREVKLVPLTYQRSIKGQKLESACHGDRGQEVKQELFLELDDRGQFLLGGSDLVTLKFCDC